MPDTWQHLRSRIAAIERFHPDEHAKLEALRAELAFVRTRNRIMRLAETLSPAQQREVIALLATPAPTGESSSPAA
jgi:hypothetical protein